MGNSQPDPVPQQNVNPVMSSIYNTSGRPLVSAGQYTPPINSKQSVPVKLDSYIDKSKILLNQQSYSNYSIEFDFTSNFRSQINIHYFSTESKEGESTYMINSNPSTLSLVFEPGNKQHFNHAFIDLSIFSPQDIFSNKKVPITIEIFPIYYEPRPVILHRTYCSFARDKERIFLKPMKQIIIHEGRLQTLMDIYGMTKGSEENICIICMCEKKNTMILPCRHLCLCSYCSMQLQSQRSKICPVCRINVAEFVAIKLE